MRTLTVLVVLFAAPIWADRAPRQSDEVAGNNKRCGSKGGSCSSHPCCPGLVCSMGICEEDDSEEAKKKAHDEHRDEPSK